MPPGVTPVVTDLSARRWQQTPHLRGTRAGTAGAEFRYTGTDAIVSNEAATLAFRVTPGTVYVFSAQTDLPGATGEADVFIDTADGTRTYAIAYAKAPASRAISTPPWKAPAGVTEVLLGMQIALSKIERGRDVRFSRPVMRAAAPAGTP